MMPSSAFFAEVAAAFRLGTPIAPPESIQGGLSNRLYRLVTDRGVFAVKRMVANAEAASFRLNVESAYRVERLAMEAGILMPHPLPVASSGEALARISDGDAPCWVRVHEWVPGEPVRARDVTHRDIETIAGVLARLHAIPAPAVYASTAPSTARDWRGSLPKDLASPDLLTTIALMEDMVQLGHTTSGPERVMSHRDLDGKNVLRVSTGELLLVDWDAAGPVVAEWDVVSTALDWSNVRNGDISTERFDLFLAAYVDGGGEPRPITTSSFAGWCEGVLDWLWFNLERSTDNDPYERDRGNAEMALTAWFMPPAARWMASYG